MLESKYPVVKRGGVLRHAGVPHPDARRHELRLLGREVDAALARLRATGATGAHAAAVDDVEMAWRSFGMRLDLGPDPEVAACPSCGATDRKSVV